MEDSKNIKKDQYLSRGTIIYGQNKTANNIMALNICSQILFVNSTLSLQETEKHMDNCAHPNFFKVTKSQEASEISISQTRSMLEFLGYKAILRSARAVFIQDAETLSISASNSILKTLEDVPDDCAIMITTSNLFSIIPTIRSRCQKIFVKDKSSENINNEIKEKLMAPNIDCAALAKSIAEAKDENLLDSFLNTARFVAYLNFVNNKDDQQLAKDYIAIEDIIYSSKETHTSPEITALVICSIIGNMHDRKKLK
jgi:DNA polymerase III delta prime subunit